MAQRELTWGDVFEEVANERPLSAEEVVNCLFAAFQDALDELERKVAACP